MSEQVVQILIILGLIILNGVFSMAEIAMVSARKIRLEQRAEEGDGGSQAALSLKDSPNRFLSTIQIGISLVGVLTGAIGGVTLSKSLTEVLVRIPAISGAAESISLILVSLAITYFSLVIGELIPKRIGLNNPEKIASTVAKPMRLLSRLTQPVVWFLSKSTDLGIKILGIQANDDTPVTEEEVKGMIEQGTISGVFEESEQNIVESVFRMSDRTVDALMTPRTEVTWLDLDEPLQINVQEILAETHSHYPVARGSLDNIQGIVSVNDMLAALLSGQHLDLEKLARQPVFVPETMPALKALAAFKDSGLTVAVVMDEYGGVLGMVTLVDIMKSIVGEIGLSGDGSEAQIILRPDGSYLLDGLLLVDELKELLDIKELPDEDRIGYQTLGGLVMSRTGAIPTAGQFFEWDRYRFEVVDMDGRRVDKVLVSLVNNETNSKERPALA